MKTPIALAVSLVVAVPAAAADLRIIVQSTKPPVILQGNETLSEASAVDMVLTPLGDSGFAFTNAAGQIVVKVPEGRSVDISTE
ncbi:hypothetical protein JANAI62_22670 [Jannaschia pagri]|uniref:Uncharacterized protein n=1 Tax=Jannaschia pagri TaxID=2829797 RepID=A0ABQ4NMN1_9RHOB|nr:MULTISPECIES: hypothetical protein [unclassified Jannaschia]GIT91810.1 hypothetical protein JANAI61_22680 [Jannaschia sp. AI_61]GIT95644.1 hypothetical protein JANAI62_22670 [Jannaschia sp. AI_62]